MRYYNNYHPSIKDRLVNDSKLAFELLKQGLDAHSVRVDGKLDTLIFTDKYNNPDGDLMNIRGDIGSFKVGSKIVNQDDGITWIAIKQLPISNPIYQDGVAQKTNNSLKFYTKDANQNSILKEIPCVVTTRISLGSSENRFMTLPDGNTIVITPNNADTLNIFIGQRFVLGRSVYKVENLDDISNVGLLNIKLSQTQKNDGDDMVNRIAVQNVPTTTVTDTSGGGW